MDQGMAGTGTPAEAEKIAWHRAEMLRRIGDAFYALEAEVQRGPGRARVGSYGISSNSFSLAPTQLLSVHISKAAKFIETVPEFAQMQATYQKAYNKTNQLTAQRSGKHVYKVN